MWPFKKKQADSQGYEGAILGALEAQASGASIRKLITGYMQSGASAWSEAFALADVQASESVRTALSPIVLAEIGRDMILQGASFHLMSVMAGGINLQRPLYVYRLAGGGGWHTQYGEPSRPVTRIASDAQVSYIPWQTEPSNPYLPVSPFRNSTGTLDKEIEAALNDELKGPVGSVLFLANPTPHADADAVENSAKAIKPLLNFEGSNRGRLATLKNPSVSMNKGFTQDSVGRPFRIGAAPPQALADLRSQLGAEILAAASIPPAMLLGTSSGPATITARRNFERTIVPARFKIVSAYLTHAFAESVTLTYPVKHRADNSTAARTVAALQKAGVPLAEAMELAGLK